MDPNGTGELSRPSNSKPTFEYSSKSELSTLSFLCLITLMSAIRAHDHPFKTLYAVNVCILAMLLLLWIDAFTRLPENSDKQEMLKTPLFILTNAVNFCYLYAVSEYLTPNMRWFMWISLGFTCLFGFFSTFSVFSPAPKTKERV